MKYAIFVTMSLKHGAGGAFGPRIMRNAGVTRILIDAVESGEGPDD